MKLITITDPKIPGSLSYALAPTKEVEKPVRENVAKSGFIANEGTVLNGTSDFWRIQKLMKQKMKF